MKKILLLVLLSSTIAFAQYRDDSSQKINIKESIVNHSPSNFFLGFLNPENFTMHHSIGMSYSSFGGQGVALGVYTNSMNFKFSDDLNLQVDASIVNTPYNSFGDDFTNQLNGIYLSRAALNYKISNKSNLFIEYRGGPGSYYSPYGFYGMFPSRQRIFDDDWYGN